MYGCPLPFEVQLEHSGESSCYSLESFHKLLVESTEAHKLSNFMDGHWSRPPSDYLDLIGVHVYCISNDDVSAKRNSLLKELQFINAGRHLVLLQ